MFINIQDVYLIVDPKGYPLDTISSPSQQIHKELQHFQTDEEQDNYLLQLSETYLLNKRWQCYTPDEIMRLNTLIAALDTGFKRNIQKLENAATYNEDQENIEATLKKYVKVLIYLPQHALIYDLRVNYNQFTKHKCNFSLIYIYSDDFELIYLVTMFFQQMYTHIENKMFDYMPIEHQAFLDNLFNNILLKRAYLNRPIDLIKDFDCWEKIKSSKKQKESEQEKNQKLEASTKHAFNNYNQVQNEQNQNILNLQWQINTTINKESIKIQYDPDIIHGQSLLYAKKIVQQSCKDDKINIFLNREFVDLLVQLKFWKNYNNKEQRIYFFLIIILLSNLRLKNADSLLKNCNQQIQAQQKQKDQESKDIIYEMMDFFDIYEDSLVMQIFLVPSYPFISNCFQLCKPTDVQKMFEYKENGNNQIRQFQLSYEDHFLQLMFSVLHGHNDSIYQMKEENNIALKNSYMHYLSQFYSNVLAVQSGLKNLIDNYKDHENTQKLNDLCSIHKDYVAYGDQIIEFFTNFNKQTFSWLLVDNNSQDQRNNVVTEKNKQQEHDQQQFVVTNISQQQLEEIMMFYPILAAFQKFYDKQSTPFSESIFKILVNLIHLVLKRVDDLIAAIGEIQLEMFILMALNTFFTQNKTDYCITLTRRLLNKQFFQEILSALQSENVNLDEHKNNITNQVRFTHFIFNQTLYLCLNGSETQVTDYIITQHGGDLEKVFYQFVQIFSQLEKQGIIVFLKIFSILKKIVQDIIKQCQQQIQQNNLQNNSSFTYQQLVLQIIQANPIYYKICQVYIQIASKNLLIWGQKAGFHDHQTNIELLFPLLLQEFLVLVQKVKIVINKEYEILKKLLDQKSTDYQEYEQLISSSETHSSQPEDRNKTKFIKKSLIKRKAQISTQSLAHHAFVSYLTSLSFKHKSMAEHSLYFIYFTYSILGKTFTEEQFDAIFELIVLSHSPIILGITKRDIQNSQLHVGAFKDISANLLDLINKFTNEDSENLRMPYQYIMRQCIKQLKKMPNLMEVIFKEKRLGRQFWHAFWDIRRYNIFKLLSLQGGSQDDQENRDKNKKEIYCNGVMFETLTQIRRTEFYLYFAFKALKLNKNYGDQITVENLQVELVDNNNTDNSNFDDFNNIKRSCLNQIIEFFLNNYEYAMQFFFKNVLLTFFWHWHTKVDLYQKKYQQLPETQATKINQLKNQLQNQESIWFNLLEKFKVENMHIIHFILTKFKNFFLYTNVFNFYNLHSYKQPQIDLEIQQENSQQDCEKEKQEQESDLLTISQQQGQGNYQKDQAIQEQQKIEQDYIMKAIIYAKNQMQKFVHLQQTVFLDKTNHLLDKFDRLTENLSCKKISDKAEKKIGKLLLAINFYLLLQIKMAFGSKNRSNFHFFCLFSRVNYNTLERVFKTLIYYYSVSDIKLVVQQSNSNCNLIQIQIYELINKLQKNQKSLLKLMFLDLMSVQRINFNYNESQLDAQELTKFHQIQTINLDQQQQNDIYKIESTDQLIMPYINCIKYIILFQISNKSNENDEEILKNITDFYSELSGAILTKVVEQFSKSKEVNAIASQIGEHQLNVNQNSNENKEKAIMQTNLMQYGLQIINMFLECTYIHRSRIRSCYFFSVVIQYIKIKTNNDEKRIVNEKSIFCGFFLHYLNQHMKLFSKNWSIESNGSTFMRTQSKQAFIALEQSEERLHLKTYGLENLNILIAACTQAMINNLVSRLIQEGINNNPDLDQGILQMFGEDWNSCKGFYHYIVEVMKQIKDCKISKDEITTLDYDPFRYSIILIQNVLNNSNGFLSSVPARSPSNEESSSLSQEKLQMIHQQQQQWAELGEIAKQILVNYCQVQINHLYTFKQTEFMFVKQEAFKKYLGIFGMTLFQHPSQQMLDSVFNEVLPILEQTPIYQNEFKEWNAQIYTELQQICMAFGILNDIQFEEQNMLLHFKTFFYDSIQRKIISHRSNGHLNNNEELQQLVACQHKAYLNIAERYFSIRQVWIYNSFKIEDYCQPSAKSYQIPKNIIRILDFLIETYIKNVNKLSISLQEKNVLQNECLSKEQQLFQEQQQGQDQNGLPNNKKKSDSNQDQQNPNYYSVFSHEVCMKIIIVFCGRWPTLINYIINKQIEVDKIMQGNQYQSHLNNIFNVKQQNNSAELSNSISFLEYLYRMLPYSFGTSCSFFKFLISSNSNFFFFSEGQEASTNLCSSSIFFREYFILKLINSINEFSSKCNEFLMSESSIFEFEEMLKCLHIFFFISKYGSYQESIDKKEELYLQQNQGLELPQQYIERKGKMLQMIYKSLQNILQTCKNNQSSILILQSIQFFEIFYQFYREKVKLLYYIKVKRCLINKEKKKLIYNLNQHWINNRFESGNDQIIGDNNQNNISINESDNVKSLVFQQHQMLLSLYNKTQLDEDKQLIENTTRSDHYNQEISKEMQNYEFSCNKYYLPYVESKNSFGGEQFGIQFDSINSELIKNLFKKKQVSQTFNNKFYQIRENWRHNYVSDDSLNSDNDNNNWYSKYLFNRVQVATHKGMQSNHIFDKLNYLLNIKQNQKQQSQIIQQSTDIDKGKTSQDNEFEQYDFNFLFQEMNSDDLDILPIQQGDNTATIIKVESNQNNDQQLKTEDSLPPLEPSEEQQSQDNLNQITLEKEKKQEVTNILEEKNQEQIIQNQDNDKYNSSSSYRESPSNNQLEEEKIDEQEAFVKEIFDWTIYDYPSNALKLYKIDINQFLQLNNEEKLDFLYQKRQLYEQNLTLFDFDSVGYQKQDLEKFKIDEGYFYALPDNIKKEVLDQGKIDFENNQEKVALEEIFLFNKKNEEIKYIISQTREIKHLEHFLQHLNSKGGNVKYQTSDIDKLNQHLLQLEGEKLEEFLLQSDPQFIKQLSKILQEKTKEFKQKIDNSEDDEPQLINKSLLDIFYKEDSDANDDDEQEENDDENCQKHQEEDEKKEQEKEIPNTEEKQQENVKDNDDQEEKDKPEEDDQTIEFQFNQKQSQLDQEGEQLKEQNKNKRLRKHNNKQSNQLQNIDNHSDINELSIKPLLIKQDTSIQCVDEKVQVDNNLELADISLKDFIDVSIFNQIPLVEDECIEQILSTLFFNLETSSKKLEDERKQYQCIFKILKWICTNPINGYKVVDALMYFISINTADYLKQISEKKDQEQGIYTFPPYDALLKQITESYPINSVLSRFNFRLCFIIRQMMYQHICLPFFMLGKFSATQKLYLKEEDCASQLDNQQNQSCSQEKNYLLSFKSLQSIQAQRNIHNSIQKNQDSLNKLYKCMDDQELSLLSQAVRLIGEDYWNKQDFEEIIEVVKCCMKFGEYQQVNNVYQLSYDQLLHNNVHNKQQLNPSTKILSQQTQQYPQMEETYNIIDQQINQFTEIVKYEGEQKQKKISKKNDKQLKKNNNCKLCSFQNSSSSISQPKFKINGQILSDQLLYTYCQIIVKTNKRLKIDKMFQDILTMLIQINPDNFSRVFFYVINEYAHVAQNKLPELIQKFEKFKCDKLKDHQIQTPLQSSIKNADNFQIICQQFSTQLQAIHFDFEIFHVMRHFIVDMQNIFFEPLINRIVKWRFKDEILNWKKNIQKLQDISYYSEESSQISNLEGQLIKLQQDFIIFLQQKQIVIRIEQSTFYQTIFTKTVKPILVVYKDLLDLINQICDFFGTKEFEQITQLTVIYYNWLYIFKSLLCLHQFLYPKQQSLENQNQKIKIVNDNIGDQQQTVLDSKVDESTDLLKLSRLILFSKEETKVFLSQNQDNLNSPLFLAASAKNSNSREFLELSNHSAEQLTNPSYQSQSSNLHLDLIVCFNLMFDKCANIIQYFISSKPDRINHYEPFLILNPQKQHLDLDIKQQYIKSISQRAAGKYLKQEWNDNLYIRIDRNSTWECTLKQLLKVSAPELVMKQVKIQYNNEEGIDYGGLTKEWLSLLGKDVFNPDFGLFKMAANKRSIQPSPFSFIVPDHLTHFRYLGRLVGKSLIEKWIMDVDFTLSFIKHILKKPLLINDMNELDPTVYKSIKYLLDNQIDDLGIDFSYILNIFGETQIVELTKDGKSIQVNETNKKEYIKALCIAKMTSEIEHQTLAFIQGLEEVVPREALDLLTENDLGIHLAGMPTLDLNDLKQNTQYQNYDENSDVIIWFWDVLNSYDDKMKANFLFFLTGSFKVPFGGFKNQPMKIEKSYQSNEYLPVAHTCFNQIDIPEYDSRDKLKEKFNYALKDGYQGFHIG